MENDSKKTLDDFLAAVSPLRGLTKPDIDNMLECAKRGNDARLQAAFAAMERNMPIFGVCIQKRLSGVQRRKWKLEPIDDSPATEQATKKIERLFKESDFKNRDSLTEAVRHLSTAVFRGRAVVKAFVDGNGLRFKKLENWNALYHNGRFYFNPEPEKRWCDGVDGLVEIPAEEICYVTEELPVDVPGIQVYLRQLVGEETWARAVEKYGVAQVLITAPDGTPDSSMDQWTMRAQRIVEGGSGVLPAGSSATQLTAARGQDPFSEYIRHQMEIISILATGGTLGTVGGSTGLGSNLADVQNDQFEQMIEWDCKRIANALTETAVRRCAEFLGYDFIPCRFTFYVEDEKNKTEYVDLLTKLTAAGVKIDLDEFKRVSGLTFIKTDEEWTPPKADENTEEEWKPDERNTAD